MPSWLGPRRWLVAAGVAALVLAGVVVRNQRAPDPTPVAVHREVAAGEALLCVAPVEVEDRAEPSRDRQTVEPDPSIGQDPRCPDEPAPVGSDALVHHDEDPGDVGAVVLAGTLTRDAGSSCTYLDTATGSVGIVWPPGTGVRPDPLRITAPDGSTLASIGTSVRLRGRYVDGAARACGPVRDGDLAFFVGTVTDR